MRQPHGDLARVVARGAVLLVGGVVLLIEHDQAGIRQRAEDGGACPDHRVDGAGAGALPLVQALALGEAAVQQGHAAGEAGREAVHRLRCERDLRHQHNPLAPQRDRGG